ncbi:hypothetical protein BD408DRAFT_375127, partial [Parasitella parasitica]
MPKLRYKEHEKKERKESCHGKKHKSSSKGSKKKYYTPPTLYEQEDGWEAPSSSYKQDEAAWREHLFDAMIEDEGQDPFYTSYQQPTPADVMTEEEYRQHIVNGMYRRTHAEDIAAEEKRQAQKEKKRLEQERAKLEQEERHAEQIRLQQAYSRLKAVSSSKADYAEKWKKLDALEVVHKKDIPWPLVGKEFSLDSVRSFVVEAGAESSEIKKNVRKEQTRYHPDKFITRYMKKFKGSEKERQRVLTHINEISGWLNEIWTQL